MKISFRIISVFTITIFTHLDLCSKEKENHKFAYYKDGEIHINVLGTPEGRRLVHAKEVHNWKTAICIINADGSEFHQITDGTHTDFNQTWTRDGKNTPIWNRRKPGGGGYQVMAGKIGGTPGEEVALTGKGYNTWAFTCLKD